ncbi:MAG: dTMP kinase [Eubacteriales bacterium]|nr:dTMP kinase [Eubacteriales bacterium]
MEASRNRAFFICVEGIDGSGKSTQIEYLREHFESRGLQVACFREPGGSQIGEAIRTLLKRDWHSTGVDLCPESEFLLFSASRAQFCREVLAPAMADNDLVICDRYYPSSLAYQGFGRNLDRQMIESITRFAIAEFEADCYVYLDLDFRAARERMLSTRSAAEDRFDWETEAFWTRVLSGYRAFFRTPELMKRTIWIDAAADALSVRREILLALDRRLDEAEDAGQSRLCDKE